VVLCQKPFLCQRRLSRQKTLIQVFWANDELVQLQLTLLSVTPIVLHLKYCWSLSDFPFWSTYVFQAVWWAGSYLLHKPLLADLRTGTIIFEVLHSWGIVPVEIDILKGLQGGIAIAWAVPFNICLEIPSGPVALDISISSNMSLTISGVHNVVTWD